MKIVITAPSLDETRNVSGISTVVRQIIEHSPHNFSHFQAGREDNERAAALWIARQAFLPVRFFARIIREKADIVHINTAFTELSIWRDTALSRAAKVAGRNIVLSIHGGKYIVSDISSRSTAAVAGDLLSLAHTVVVLSEFEKQEVLRRWSGVNVQVLPNAVPLHPPVSRPNNAVPIILFMGRLHESKGLDEIATALEKLKLDGFDFQFDCFGDGPMRDVFVARMRTLLGQGFNYGGIVRGAEKRTAFGKADIFLLPSLYGEGLPMALLEAMAAGCVAITSEMASVSAVIQDGTNGYLIVPGNTAQLISRLKLVLSSRSEWRPVQQAAIMTVEEKFSMPGYLEKLEEIYRSAAG